MKFYLIPFFFLTYAKASDRVLSNVLYECGLQMGTLLAESVENPVKGKLAQLASDFGDYFAQINLLNEAKTETQKKQLMDSLRGTIQSIEFELSELDTVSGKVVTKIEKACGVTYVKY